MDNLNRNLRKSHKELEARVRERTAALEAEVAEHKKTEEALRESEEVFSRIFHHSPLAMALTHLESDIFVDVNEEFLNLTGYSRREVIGKSALDLKLFANPQESKEIGCRLSTDGKLHNISVALNTKTGNKAQLLWSAEIVKIGKELCIVSSGVDITELKRFQDVLREYQVTIEASHHLVAVVDKDYKFRMINDEYLKRRGLQREHVINKSLEQVLGKNVFEETVKPKIDMCFRGMLVNYETQYTYPATGTRDMNTKYYPLRNKAGVVDRAVCVITDITDRRNAEQALRESETRYRSIFENIQDIYFETTLDGTVLEVSPSVANYFLYTREELIGRSLGNLYASIGERKTFLARLHKARVINDYEIDLKDKNGERIPVAATAKLIFDAQGLPVKIVGILRSIAERMKTEHDLRESEAKFRLLFNEMQEGFALHEMICDENGAPTDYRFLIANPAFEKLTGHKASDIIGKTAKEVWPDIAPDWTRAYGDVALTGKPVVFEKYFGPTGKYYRVSAFSPRKGQFAVVFDDITTRKNIEDSLRESEHKLRTIFEQAGVGVIQVANETGKFVRVNQRFCDITGYSQEELLASTFQFLSHPDDLQETLDKLELLTEGEIDEFSLEKRYRHKNGSIVWVNLTVRPMRIPDGWTDYYIGVIQDITQNKRLEEQLIQAQKMEAIGTLAGGIAHDFNNILGAIIGYAGMAQEELQEGNPTRECVDEIYKAGERAKFLVQQILAFSRHVEAEKKPLMIGPILKEVLKLLRHALPATIRINKNIHVKDGLILADATQIHQLLMNLCMNAGQAMRENGGTLTVDLDQIEIAQDHMPGYESMAAGSYLELKVSDTGHGIDPAILSRIFDPFFTTKKKGEGTGMGLAVVYGIVKSYGGRVSVASTLGKGTTFTVYFPVIHQQMILSQNDIREDISTGNERILLVDDQDYLLQTMKIMLTRLGYTVTAKQSSPDALALFMANPDAFDMMITDQTMPDLTGANLARKVLSIRPNLPIILCTGFSDLVSREEAKLIGVREYLMKPIAIRDLANIIRNVLEGKEGYGQGSDNR